MGDPGAGVMQHSRARFVSEAFAKDVLPSAQD
jgi:hypothetical protein